MRTKLYRVLIWAASGAAIVVACIDKFGPGVGLTPWDITVISAAATGLIMLGHQISDPATPTLPTTPVQPPAPNGANTTMQPPSITLASGAPLTTLDAGPNVPTSTQPPAAP